MATSIIIENGRIITERNNDDHVHAITRFDTVSGDIVRVEAVLQKGLDAYEWSAQKWNENTGKYSDVVQGANIDAGKARSEMISYMANCLGV